MATAKEMRAQTSTRAQLYAPVIKLYASSGWKTSSFLEERQRFCKVIRNDFAPISRLVSRLKRLVNTDGQK